MRRGALVLALVACKSPPASDVTAPKPAAKGPSIRVETSWPGVSAANLAATVATPLERRFGRIPNLERMTSRSRRGETTIQLEFGSGSDEDAARAVQQAIDAAKPDLPEALPAP